MVHFLKVSVSEVFVRGKKRILKRSEMGSSERQTEWWVSNERSHGERRNQK